MASKWLKVAEVLNAGVLAAGALQEQANRAAFRAEQRQQAPGPGGGESDKYYAEAALDARIQLRYESSVQAELRAWVCLVLSRNFVHK